MSWGSFATIITDNEGSFTLQAEVTKESSADHTGSFVSVPAGIKRALLKLKITAITVPDSADSWRIYVNKRINSSGDVQIGTYFIDTENAGDLTTTTGDLNRGRFRNTGEFDAIVDDPGEAIQVIAEAVDENSDDDMSITFSVEGYWVSK